MGNYKKWELPNMTTPFARDNQHPQNHTTVSLAKVICKQHNRVISQLAELLQRIQRDTKQAIGIQGGKSMPNISLFFTTESEILQQ